MKARQRDLTPVLRRPVEPARVNRTCGGCEHTSAFDECARGQCFDALRAISLADKNSIHHRIFGAAMRRRDFLGVLSGAVALPLTAGAQQSGRTYRVAYLALLPDEDTTLAK